VLLLVFELTDQLASTSSTLESLRAEHDETASALSSLREEHTALVAAKEQLITEAEQLRAALQVRLLLCVDLAGRWSEPCLS